MDYEAAIGRILEAAETQSPLACTAVAVHAVMTGVHDPEHLHRLQHLDLLVPDGQPVRIALRFLHGVRLNDRVYGPDLMLLICEQCAKRGLPVWLFPLTREPRRLWRRYLLLSPEFVFRVILNRNHVQPASPPVKDILPG